MLCEYIVVILVHTKFSECKIVHTSSESSEVYVLQHLLKYNFVLV